MDRSGILIAIEGTDESKTNTQCQKLHDQLVKDGFEVVSLPFPRLEHEASYFIRQQQDGELSQENPYTNALLHALDRYQASHQIQEAILAGKIVLVRHYTGATMAEQGVRFQHPEERRGFFIWLDNLEFQMLGVVRPNRTLVLQTTATHDGVSEVYDDLCQLFPKDFTRIDGVRGEQAISAASLAKLLRETVQPLLPAHESEESDIGTPSYFVPKTLDDETRKLYTETMEHLIAQYQQLRKSVSDKAAVRQVLPVACLGQDGHVPGVSFEAEDSRDLRTIADTHLPPELAPPAELAQLVDFAPRNELDLTTDILYHQTSMPLRAIRAETMTWPYERKLQVLQAYLSQSDGQAPALDSVQYNWDLLSSLDTYAVYEALGLGTGRDQQPLTPRYGYSVPDSIEDPETVELFQACFDTSLALYSQLQAAGYAHEAQYATLLGHKLRWKITYSLPEIRQLEKLVSGMQHEDSTTLFSSIREKLAEVHPILGDWLGRH